MSHDAEDVHGIVVETLQRFVHLEAGPAAWDQLVAGRPALEEVDRRATYPDAEVVGLARDAAAALDVPLDALLRDFGAFLAPVLLVSYPALVDPAWRTLDVIEHVDAVVHSAVREAAPEARPPGMRVVRRDADHLTIFYGSARGLCQVAHGIVLGLAEVYDQHVTVLETSCMHRGDATCELDVQHLPVAA